MISDEYHKWYEEKRIWEKTEWLGVPMWKLPFDAFIMQELICKVRPNVLIETGSGFGGSSVFYASIMQMINHGKVITIDVDIKKQRMYRCLSIDVLERIHVIEGSSTREDVLYNLEKHLLAHYTNMVVLDSWHSYDHVLEEMRKYEKYVSKDSYMVVEDTHVNGHPVEWKHGKGPYEAVETFLKENDDFVIDEDCEKYKMTFNPKGYLRRVK
jgi:cephalosporin hydroxylase